MSLCLSQSLLMRILVIEDEKKVARFIERGLKEEGFAVDIAQDGEEGLFLAQSNPYDLIVLDVLMPKKDGFQVLRELRAAKCPARVLMLTARDSVQDRVQGLDSGADDYLVKPFAFAEFLARVRSLLRRGTEDDPVELRALDLTLDLKTRKVIRVGKPAVLSAKEFALLELMMRRPGRVLSRLEILDHAWNMDYENRSNVIDVFIRRLREKIDRPFGTQSLETVRGAGYRLREDHRA